MEQIYAAIDLKSFYASVECIERKLDPLATNLVVADPSRTDKTICLAVSPALKAQGIPGRPRLFEVLEKVKLINARRKEFAPKREFSGSSTSAKALEQDKSLALDFIIAPPQMAHYVQCSTEIYKVYLKYIAPEDIHVYSIDEVFINLTPYLELYKLSARELVIKMLREVLLTTGITATAGIGTNLYLAKIAMDIVAKHMPANEDGVRLAFLDEKSYRRQLWAHQPLTDFWRIGSGYAKKLARYGIFTMGDIARCSLGTGRYYGEDLLYKLFGINAELLIDHAWGWEPCTIKEIKAYHPTANSLSSGQVLQCPYTYDKTVVVVREMAEELALHLMQKKLVADHIVLTIGYDRENLVGEKAAQYSGELHLDHYGRLVPKHAHGTARFHFFTSSSTCIINTVLGLLERIIDKNLLVRRVNITAGHVITEEEEIFNKQFQEIDLFEQVQSDESEQAAHTSLEQERERDAKRQRAVLELKERFGKNAILRGTNYMQGATAQERNQQIGGHKA